MVKKIDIDASDNPDLARKVFSVAMGVKPLPDDLSDNRSGKQIVHDMAKEIGVSKAEGERLARKVLQREILTEGVNAKLGGSFSDPLNTVVENPSIPSFDEVMRRASRFDGGTDRAEFAAQAIKDRRVGRDNTGSIHIDADTPAIRELRDVPGFTAALRGWVAWAEKRGEYALGRVDQSAWHKVREAHEATKILWGSVDVDGFDSGNNFKIDGSYDPYLIHEPQIFLVQHNWAAAFDGAKDFSEGEFPLPFDHCAFEFRLDGRRVFVVTVERNCTVISEIGEGWWVASVIGPLEGVADTKRYPALYKLIRAICIALDAEVAMTSVTRAPHRLNYQRERQGKFPVNDFHVISLAKRSRIEALPSASDEPKHHKRLHFRRGHWRHFSDHKTWIKWMLVGDPDLGFIDKEYRA
jgi:hypothetical protein